jgi:outer membrane immunogenic protein
MVRNHKSAGYLPADWLLVYATGGLAYGRVEHSGAYSNASSVTFIGGAPGQPSYSCNAGTTCFDGSSGGTEVGWTAGGGIEFAFWNNLTLKVEYLYVNLGRKSVTQTAIALFPFPGSTGPASFNTNYNDTDFSIVRAGLNCNSDDVWQSMRKARAVSRL